jgi:hypothetical protein
MKNNSPLLWITALLALGIALFGAHAAASRAGIFEAPRSDAAGAITSTTKAIIRAAGFVTSGTFKVGASGTSLAGIVTGSCTIWAPATTIAASTTQQVECQSSTSGSLASGLSGVTSDSTCVLRMASSTNTTSNGLVMGGTSASSTDGSIVGQVSNLTGGTFTWNATASSSAKWKYACFDPA